MSDASTAVIHVPTREVSAQDFLPMLTVEQAVERKQQINKFIQAVMRKGEDYDSLPGYNKPELLKPGAEKLCSIFGLVPRYIVEVQTEDWSGAEHGGEPLFYYRYKCQLYRGEIFMGEATGSSNSRESKHRYRWIPEHEARRRPDFEALPKRGGKQFEFAFAIRAKDTGGKYGKPLEYWAQFDKAIAEGEAVQTERQTSRGVKPGYEIDATVYRIPNPDIADVVNTVLKISQKRALVAAVLIVTNCSDAFTQDLTEGEAEPAPKAEETRAPEDKKDPPAPPDPPELVEYLKQFTGKADHDEPLVADMYQAVKEAHGEETARELWRMFGNPNKDPKLYAAKARQMWFTMNPAKAHK